MPDYYIGLDQSLSATGVAVWHQQENKIITYCIKVQGSQDAEPYERILQLKQQVEYLLKLTTPSWLFVEEPYQSQGRQRTNPTTYKLLVGIMTAIRLSAEELGVPHRGIPSGITKTSWPNILGCKKPKEAWRACIPHCPAEASLDESDAIGVLWAGLVSQGLVTPEQIKESTITKLNYVHIHRNSASHRIQKAGEFHLELLQNLGVRGVPEEVLA